MTLAEKILSLRTEKGLSQEDLAGKMEVSRQSVSKWETAQSVPDLDKIIKLADLFGVSVDELVRDKTPPSKPVKPQKRERPINYLLFRWDPVWPWLEGKGHRQLLACILIWLIFPAAALRLGTVPIVTLPILGFEFLLVKRRTMALVFATLIVAVGLTWPAFGMGELVALFVLTPVLFIAG